MASFSTWTFGTQIRCGLVVGLFFGFSWGDLSARNQGDNGGGLIRCYGKVVDGGGMPLENVDVFLAAVVEDWFASRGTPWPVDYLAARTTADGNFELSFQRDDPRFLVGRRFTLIVRKDHFGAVAQRVHLYRMLVDLPMAIELRPADERPVQVLDPFGGPLSNATVGLCANGATPTPFNIASQFTSVTTERGEATLRDVSPSGYPVVYVQSEEFGNQCLRCGPGIAGWCVQVRPTIKRHLKIQLPADAQCARLAEIETQALVALSNLRLEDGRPLEYGWETRFSDEHGNVQLRNIVVGQPTLHFVVPETIGFRPHLRLMTDDWTRSPEPVVEIPFRRAIPVRGQITNAINGQPVPNIVLGRASRDFATISDAAGQFKTWIAEGDFRDFFVVDPLGEFLQPTTYYGRIAGQIGQLEIVENPKPLLPALHLTGSVRDRQGNPVVGAIVQCRKKQGRTLHDAEQFYTDATGTFQIRGFAEGDTVEFFAFADQLALAEKQTIVLTPESNLGLVIEPITFPKFVGSIVDSAGEPIGNAVVLIERGYVYEAEGRNLEKVYPERPNFQEHLVVTDVSGEFVSPPAPDWTSKIRIRVFAPGFFPFCSPWMDMAPQSGPEATRSLGRWTLCAAPNLRKTLVTIVDSAGRPQPGAKVAFVAGYRDPVHGITDQQGQLRIEVPDERQIAAIETADQTYSFRVIPGVESEMTLEVRLGAPAAAPETQFETVEACRAQAARWLERFKSVSVFESSAFRAQCLLVLQAVADPEQFRKLVQTQDIGSQPLNNAEIAWSLLTRGISHEHKDLSPLRQKLGIDQTGNQNDGISQIYYEIEHATRLNDLGARLDRLSEILIQCRTLSGADQTMTMARLASQLWRCSQRDAARSVLREARELNLSLHATERGTENLAGIGRSFAAKYALVDLPEALRLIELTCYREEVDSFKTVALALLAESDPAQFDERLGQLRPNQIAPSDLRDALDTLELSDRATGERLLRLLPEGDEKSRFLVSMADRLSKDTTSSLTAREWCQRALQYQLQRHSTNFFDTPAVHAAQIIGPAQRAAPELVDASIFAALWSMKTNDFDTMFSTVSSVAMHLAEFRPDLARVLVAPAFENSAWIHASGSDAALYLCPPLRAACRVDLAWGDELLQQLWNTSLHGDTAAQLAVAQVAASELQRRIVEIEDRAGATRD